MPQLEQEFHGAVDDYLATCEATGISPCKPFKGSFNVRIGAPLHQSVAILAARHGVSLNDFIKSTLEKAVASEIPTEEATDDEGKPLTVVN